MKRLSIFALALLLSISAFAQESTKSKLTQHVYYLASDELNGRAAGSADAEKAREYIKNEYVQMGLLPFFEEWEQPFQMESGDYTNLVAVIEGNDPVLKNEYIVLGAHFDHLGFKNGEVYNGADDNASGSAALIEIARNLTMHRDQLKRSVIIAAFDGEELGLYGSNKLAKRLKATNVNVVFMMSIDMVGWYGKSGKLTLEGTKTFSTGEDIVEKLAKQDGIVVKSKPFETSILTATDTQGFAQNGVPTIAASTGLKSPYHKPGDDADLIDYDGLELVTNYLSDLSIEIASNPDFKSTGQVASKHATNITPQKSRVVDFSLVGGLGSADIDFKDAAFTGKSDFSYIAGVSVKFQLKALKLRTGVLWEGSKAQFPSATDPFHAKVDYKQNALTVPVTFDIINVGFGPVGYLFSFGGYYSRVMGDPKVPGTDFYAMQNQYGIAYTMLVRIGHLGLGGTVFDQHKNLFDGSRVPAGSTEAPNASLSRGYFTMTWTF